MVAGSWHPMRVQLAGSVGLPPGPAAPSWFLKIPDATPPSVSPLKQPGPVSIGSQACVLPKLGADVLLQFSQGSILWHAKEVQVVQPLPGEFS